MTLCVAWRTKGNPDIHIASDSRITHVDLHSDYGVKVFQVPVRVYGPRDSKTNRTPVIFQRDYGLAFAGSFLGVQTIREFLFIALQRLQAISPADVSFDSICGWIERLASHLTSRLSAELKHEHSVDFFVAGHCPRHNDLRMAKFFTSDDGKYHCTTRDTDEFIDAIGSGKDAFSNAVKVIDWQVILPAIDQLAYDVAVPDVGGNIQYGHFDSSGNFATRGIARVEMDGFGIMRNRYWIAGIDMNGDEFVPRAADLSIIGEYIDPF